MAAVPVLNTPDDGCLRSKHVEWLCRNKTCTVLHQVGFYLTYTMIHGKTKLKNEEQFYIGSQLLLDVKKSATGTGKEQSVTILKK